MMPAQTAVGQGSIRGLLVGNPVLVKHLRSRLRPQHVLPLVAVVVALSICIAWVGVTSDENGSAVAMMFVLQGLILFLVGAAAVATSVGTARETGMLDFHRISPQPATAVALGFLLGAPVREYILFACTLPFSLLLALAARYSALAWLAVTFDLVVVSQLYCAIALLLGLALPKRASATTLTLLAVVLFHMGWMTQTVGCLTILPTALGMFVGHTPSLPLGTAMLGFAAPPLFVSLLHQVPVFVLLLVAGARKMHHESAYPLTKLDAVGCYLVAALLLLADAPAGFEMTPDVGAWALCYGLLFIGVLLSALVTPGAGAFAKGVRRARKIGLPNLGLWDDQAPNWAVVLAFAVIFAAAAAAVGTLFPQRGWWHGMHPAGAGVVGAAAVMFFGLANQAFGLTFRRNSNPYLMLLLFICWGLPLVVGLLVLSISGGEDATSNLILALSPLSGLAIMLMNGTTASLATARTVALVASSALAFAFIVFATRAVTRARREAGEV